MKSNLHHELESWTKLTYDLSASLVQGRYLARFLKHRLFYRPRILHLVRRATNL
jgi:hypothetical protein